MRLLGPVASAPEFTAEQLLDELNDFRVGLREWVMVSGPSVDVDGAYVHDTPSMPVLQCRGTDTTVALRVAHGGVFSRTAFFDASLPHGELPVAEVLCFYPDRFDMMREVHELFAQIPDAGPS